MAASFVSPLFWQIEFIVQNGLASKKEVKTSVSELDKLVELYGHDAEVFLVRSLFAVIDFRKEHHSHQQHQVNLLSQTMTRLSTKPNFGSVLCLALTGDGTTTNDDYKTGKQGPIDQAFVASLCRVLKLPVAQQIIVGVVIANWDAYKSIQLSGRSFLKNKLNEIALQINKEQQQQASKETKKKEATGEEAAEDITHKSPALAGVPTEVLHQLAHTMLIPLNSNDAFGKGKNNKTTGKYSKATLFRKM